ncbi:type VII secretion protein EccCb [Nocardia sp. NPDC057030]|uniref:type VII secretion protein EccCb n=1 Tax=unclassified Nocardia TaxID=2637762 RepID=UPI0036408527
MTSPRGRRIALFVANDTFYSTSISQLYAPVSDARELRNLLHDPSIGAFQPAEILVNESKTEIERSIERLFRNAGPEDLVLFYYSGHGFRTSRNLYLAACNTDPNLPSSSAVSSAFIKELIRESSAAAKIILLDCCYSGAFLGNDVIKAVGGIDDGVGEHLVTGDGICVMTACTGVQIAEDGIRSAADDSVPLSMFTSAIVNGITTTGLAGNGTGEISTHDLWTYVSDEVRRRTDRQTPSHYGFLNDEVFIARTRRRPAGASDGGDRVLLGSLLGRLEQVEDAGLRAESWCGTGRLAVPIGRQRRPDGTVGDIVQLEFAGPDNGLLVVGRAGSGKSTLLRTLVAALALTHSADEARVHVLESSNRLGSMRELPHVGDVVCDDEPERVAALLQGLLDEISNRKRLYRKHNIDSPASLRAARDALPERPVPDLFLVLDRWDDFADLLPKVGDTVRRIADAGPEYAVHVVATVRDWNDVPDWMSRLLAVQIELRMHQPRDSRIDPELAIRLPEGPGWGLHQLQPFRIAVPDIREPPADPAMMDDMTDGAADLVARMRARHAAAGTGAGSAGPDVEADFAALHGLDDVSEFDIEHWWRERPVRELLRIPIGATRPGDPVLLDLKQGAEGGMGPHGLVVGAIGAGKSELLRTIVLGLALHHGPDQVNFLLVDFKNGATFQPLTSLRHLAGHVRDVEQDLYLRERLQEVLDGEIDRRRRLLEESGPYTTIGEYEQARAAGAVLPPLPALVIVIEEFVELLSGTSTFVDVLVRIGRLGRSLGMHLLLGTQRPDEWRLRALDSYLSYRIALRTFSAAESRLVLGTTDAYHLPRIPGYGYLRIGTGTATRFRAAYASGPGPSVPGGGGAGPVDRPVSESLAVALGRHGSAAHQVWTEPLRTSPTVGMLLRQWNSSPSAEGPGLLRLPIGVVDVPRKHYREVLCADLSDSSGHMAIVGGPRSGKSTALRTLIVSAAATHTPEQVQFYCLDLGGALAGLAEFPHVGSVAGRRDSDRVRRTVAELATLVGRREQRFRELGLASMHEFRSRKARVDRLSTEKQAADPISADRYGDVFLIVDGLDVVQQDYPALEATILTVATQGPRYGIHVVVTLPPWTRTRLASPDMIGTLIELRLGDPADSQLDRAAAGTVPPDRPGRGLSPDKLHLLIALPRLDSDTDPKQLPSGMAAAAKQLRTIYGSRQAPEIRLLPTEIPRAHVLRAALHAGLTQDATHLAVGLGENELSPLILDFDAQPHLMAFADQGCGKTTLLHNILLGITENATPDQAAILLVDYRRTLRHAVDPAYLTAYCAAAASVPDAVEHLCRTLATRIPGPDIGPAQLRERTWWTGPELYVVVDDHDLIVTDGDDPLEPLLEFLPTAHDIGLHLVIARRATNLARALTGTLLGRLHEISATTLLMSAPTEAGKPFTPTLRATPLPPGRGTLLTRTQPPQLIQVAHLPPPH